MASALSLSHVPLSIKSPSSINTLFDTHSKTFSGTIPKLLSCNWMAMSGRQVATLYRRRAKYSHILSPSHKLQAVIMLVNKDYSEWKYPLTSIRQYREASRCRQTLTECQVYCFKVIEHRKGYWNWMRNFMNPASQDRINAKENEFRNQWWPDSKFEIMKSLTTF